MWVIIGYTGLIIESNHYISSFMSPLFWVVYDIRMLSVTDWLPVCSLLGGQPFISSRVPVLA